CHTNRLEVLTGASMGCWCRSRLRPVQAFPEGRRDHEVALDERIVSRALAIGLVPEPMAHQDAATTAYIDTDVRGSWRAPASRYIDEPHGIVTSCAKWPGSVRQLPLMVLGRHCDRPGSNGDTGRS